MALGQAAGQVAVPSMRMQRLSPAVPGPSGMQTLPEPQLPEDWSAPQASMRCCQLSLLEKSEVEGGQVPWAMTMGLLVSLQENGVPPPPGTAVEWHWPSW